MGGEENMELHYDKDADILMIVLSHKKIDDSYETDYGIVSITEKGEPVMIDVFKASKFLKNLKEDLQIGDKRQYPQASASVAHRVR